jgi:putative endonuclease
MDQWVYILQSESSGRFYCGQTSDVERRIRQHNDPEYDFSKTTKRFAGPWRLVKAIRCDDRSQATRLERSIKKNRRRQVSGARSTPPAAGQVWQSPAEGGINH